MSTENENQNNQLLTTEVAMAPSEKAISVICKICESTIDDGDTRLICTNKQCEAVTCNTCIKVMIEIMFGQPSFNYPLTCGACQHAFDTTDIDRILVKHECYEQFIACVFPLFWQEDCLDNNEKLAQCMYFNSFVFNSI